MRPPCERFVFLRIAGSGSRWHEPAQLYAKMAAPCPAAPREGSRLPQLRVFGLRLLQDGEILVGVLPQR
jgi:hypothetical protein